MQRETHERKSAASRAASSAVGVVGAGFASVVGGVEGRFLFQGWQGLAGGCVRGKVMEGGAG